MFFDVYRGILICELSYPKEDPKKLPLRQNQWVIPELTGTLTPKSPPFFLCTLSFTFFTFLLFSTFSQNCGCRVSLDKSSAGENLLAPPHVDPRPPKRMKYPLNPHFAVLTQDSLFRHGWCYAHAGPIALPFRDLTLLNAQANSSDVSYFFFASKSCAWTTNHAGNLFLNCKLFQKLVLEPCLDSRAVSTAFKNQQLLERSAVQEPKRPIPSNSSVTHHMMTMTSFIEASAIA